MHLGFGTTEASGDGAVDQNETNTWFAFLDENKLSWCNRSVADKAERSAALVPGASASGGWIHQQLATSGAYIRTVMKVKNLRFK